MKQVLLFFTFSLLSAFLVNINAQGIIKGKVSDENGEALISATIVLQGTTTGTVTDFDGNYEFEVSAGTHTLEVSYTGYEMQTQTVTIADNETRLIDIVLAEDVELLEEIVVIGYGTQKKNDVTGSVTSVRAEEFNRGAITSPDQLISGKVAGVQISSNSGEPGGQMTIRFRGGTSINAGNEPLFVIDGIPIDNSPHNPGGLGDGRNPLNFLNPSDIESINFLKDASAAAIYGSRAANGVIIITTKKGVKGEKARLSFNSYASISNLVDSDLNILAAEDYRNVVAAKAPERLDKLGSSSTNWYDEVTRTGYGQTHNLSLSGGSENTTYHTSLGYQQVKGVVTGSETERVSVGLNLGQTLLEGFLEMNINLKGSYTNDLFDPGVVGSSSDFDPTQPIYDNSTNAYGGFFEYDASIGPRNPVSQVMQIEDIGSSYRGIGKIDFKHDMEYLLPGLSAKLIVGYDVINGDRKRYQPRTWATLKSNGYEGEVRQENMRRTNQLLDAYFNYKKVFGGKHDIDVTAGYEYQDFKEEYPNFRAYNLAADYFGFNNPNVASDFEVSNSVIENRLIAFFGRVTYKFSEKYLITASLRRDGSTKFGPDNRWGTFPSAAIGWRVLQESWATPLTNVFSNLKFRFGFGINGNDQIDDYKYLPTFTSGRSTARVQFGDYFVTTARPNAYDPALKWEETTSYNFGMDFGFMDDRLSGSLEYYQKTTDDLLFTVNVPAGTNLTDQVLSNIGSIENQGIELTLNAILFTQSKFNWNLGFNTSYNINEVTKINTESEEGILDSGSGISGGVGNRIQTIRVGEPYKSFLVYEHLLDANGNPISDAGNELTAMYKDLNGDGMITDEDKRPFNSANPDMLLGFTSNMSYGNFDLNFSLRGMIGNYVYDDNASVAGYYDRIAERGDIFLNNLHTSALETGFQTPQYFSDYYIQDASFLKLDNVTLGYTFDNLPKSMNLRIYATGQNLLTLTEYTGLDPEVGSGIDNSAYPRARTFIFGLSLGL